jgi:nitroreductase
MPGTPNPLSEMAELKSNVVTKDERPNSKFVESALPGFKKTVMGRRAIRIFDGLPIPAEVMKGCLHDAILAPSASNLQCYEFYWTQDTERKNQLAKYCLGQPAATTAGDLVVVVSRVDLWKSHLDKLLDIMTDAGAKPLVGPIKEYYEKIVPMIMRTDPIGFQNLLRRFMLWHKSRSEPTVNGPVRRSDHRIYGHIQASLAAQNLMLSLAAHGYESCPMGGIDKRAISKLLGLPNSAEVTMVIGAGRGKPEGLFGPRVRLPFSDLVKQF